MEDIVFTQLKSSKNTAQFSQQCSVLYISAGSTDFVTDVLSEYYSHIHFFTSCKKQFEAAQKQKSNFISAFYPPTEDIKSAFQSFKRTYNLIWIDGEAFSSQIPDEPNSMSITYI